MQHLLLKAVSPNEAKRKIIVRLPRVWEGKSKNTGNVYEIAFVAVDQEGTVMEGHVPGAYMDKFKNVLKEGLVYTIEDFMVKSARDVYRTVDRQHRIALVEHTKVKETVPQPDNIPLVGCDLHPITTIEKRFKNIVVVSDAIGLLVDLTGPIYPRGDGDPRRTITIRDINGDDFGVTLWGHQAENFDEEAIRSASEQGSVIMLFVSMNVDYFLGKLCFKGTSLTRSYINPGIRAASALRTKYENEPNQVQWRDVGGPKPEAEETTIYALSKQEKGSILGKFYKLSIEVTELDASRGWWFYSCQACCKATKPNGNVYRCTGPECTSIKEEQRYRINVNAKDINPVQGEEEAIACFTFFGKQGRALTGYKEDVLIKISEGKPENYIPSAVSTVIGKKYLVIARVTQDIYRQDNVPLRVSSVELIDTPAQILPTASLDGQQRALEQNPQPLAAKDAATSSEGDVSSVATPPRDVIEDYGSEAEEDTTSTSEKRKRKSKTTNSSGTKKQVGRTLYGKK